MTDRRKDGCGGSETAGLTGIVLRCNSASPPALLRHLETCDAAFVPPLSARVVLKEYADRLVERAERIEAWATGPEGERLVGLVAIYCNAPPGGEAFITSVSVEASHRGAGLGSALISAALRRAEAAGLSCARLKVHADAVAARRAYARLGFDEVGRATGPAGTDLTLRRDLTP